MSEYPKQILESSKDEFELVARLGRWETLQELGCFGVKTMIDLTLKDEPGTFNGRVRKRFSGIYGNTLGCSEGDIECAALVTDSFDAVYDYELKLQHERKSKPA